MSRLEHEGARGGTANSTGLIDQPSVTDDFIEDFEMAEAKLKAFWQPG